MRTSRSIALCVLALVSAISLADARMTSGTYAFHTSTNSPFQYRVEVGEDSGCCVGSLTIYATDKTQNRTKKVFYAETFLLRKIVPEKGGITVIGQSSDSEAWERKNAFTYNPYRIYEIADSNPARYNLERSRSYTERFYCPWRGPKYNDRFAAVMVREGVCRTMTRQQLDRYEAEHPGRFR
jgi:hypothetical protein